MTTRDWTGLEIAVVGMAGRFPGADSVQALWRNLRDGVESIRRLDAQTLVGLGRDPAEVLAPEFVPAHGVLDGHDLFDAEFFGYRPREAEGIDPQQRLFLEVAWEALELAGIDPARSRGPIGVFAGSSSNQYLHDQLLRNPAALARIGAFQAQYSNQPDHLAARVAYKLDLTGPAVAVQTACSTSLAAVHLACQQLLAGGCDVALAGGVSLTLPHLWGYRFEEGMILSPDGHCRAFDVHARGTLKGDGVAVVVLKRLADALADGDPIDAVILGSAINNDGAAKVGYTAPGLAGQVRLLDAAFAAAGIEPGSLGYIEAHGTGTPLGDPIEIGALKQAFGPGHLAASCGIGSIKTGIGHLDAAAGVAGLIKAVLALQHATLPASLHFTQPNPQLALADSPFFVVDRSQPWPAGQPVRRAGVSSFGIGGTNAHVVLEEAPPPPACEAPGGQVHPQLLLLSARTPTALAAARQRLADRLDDPARPLPLRSVASTLALGRHAFAERCAVVASDAGEAAAGLRRSPAVAGQARDGRPSVVFLFPGQGAQYPGMGRGLYAGLPVFREQVDTCCERLLPLLGRDLRTLLFETEAGAAAQQMAQTALTQPLLFVIEYALAHSLLAQGIEPAAMVGHSVGEIVAACLAGVFTLDQALQLVAQRGRLMQAQPPGAMLAVPLSAADLLPLLPADVSLAAENAPSLCVAAGPAGSIDALASRLEQEHQLQPVRLHTSHAFHSEMMAPAVAPLLDVLAGLPRQAPTRRFVSTVSGTWADDGVTAANHWARNVRDSVRFAAALETVFGLDDVVLVEVGPGTALGALARQHDAGPAGLVCAATLRHPKDELADLPFFLGTLGKLWCAGVDIGSAWLGDPPARRVALPAYPFERQRHWVDPAPAVEPPAAATPRHHLPAWQRRAASRSLPLTGDWAVAGPRAALGPVLARLQAAGRPALGVPADTTAEWEAAWAQLAVPSPPDRLLLLAPLASSGVSSLGIPRLLRVLANQPPATELRMGLLTSGASAVLGNETLEPDQALAIGWLQVLPAELPAVQALSLDLDAFDDAAIDAALQAVQRPSPATWLARRHGHWWQRGVAPLRQPNADAAVPLRQRGVYAISGGLGAIGLALAEHLARTVQARLLLFSRRPFPPRGQWADWCETHAGDDATRMAIARLTAIEAAGGDVLIAQADVADLAALTELRERARARWGEVHGVIHCAGTPGGGLIATQQEATSAPVLVPKRQGTLALLDAFGGDALDFLVLCSSLTSFVPLAGRSDYTAANLWLDTLAQARAGTQPAIVSINFDNWTEAGMARQAAGGQALVGLRDAEGVAAFTLALALGEPQLLAAVRDLQQAADATPVPPECTSGPATGVPAGTPPGTATERQLAGLVADLLGLEQVGLDDDFFELGGDSVVSIQLVSRARRAGLALTVKQVFELRTVAAMVAVATHPTAGPAPVPSNPPRAEGRLCLTPVQHWFFELPLEAPGHWNLGLVLQTPVDADPALVQRCLDRVLARHEALRVCFQPGDGGWTASLAAADEADFRSVDLSALADDALAAAFADLQAQACAPFDLARGRLLRAVHAHGGSRPGRLFIGIHHLATDLIGARVLAEELADAWRQHDRVASEAPQGTGWARWSEHLKAHAQTTAVTATLAHWTALAAVPHVPLPRDRHGDNHNDGTATLRITLDPERTAALLAHTGSGAGIAGALLAGMAQALCAWSGQPQVWVDIEGHGREPVVDGLDPGRTVGWFTAHHPLPVQRPTENLVAAAQRITQALRDVPLNGLSHGLLRHLNDDPAVRHGMRRLPQPEVVFLYQGRRVEPADRDNPLRLLDISADFGRAAGDARSHVFEINSWIDEDGLQVDWTYSRALHATATVARLAADLDQALALMAEPAAPVPPCAAPLSFAQERIWFLQQLDPDATVYNKQGVVELEGELDAAALRAALAELVLRHGALRTRFTVADGTPAQVVEPAGAVALPMLDLQGADDAEAERVARTRGARRFDLAAAPPFHAALLRLGTTRHWLVLTLHHIIVDAWSLQVLVGDLAALYSARRRGTAAVLPPVPLRLSDFAQAQRLALSGPALDALLAQWTDRLVGLSPLELPTDRPRPAVQRFEGGRLAFRWPAALTAAVRQLGREHGASLFMALLALYKLLLQRYSGQSDIVVGIPAADRPDVETESLVGPLVNNLVLRTDLSGEPDVRAVLARVRETVLAANEHRDLPFEKLVEALRPPRDRSRSPLFQVMFAYMNVPESAAAWDGLTARTREIETGGAEFDLALYAYAPGSGPAAGLSGWFDYSSALFDRATIERLSGHLQRLGESACAEPARRAALLPLLSAGEQARIEAWNRTDTAQPPVALLHQLFEQQALKTPEATAAVFDDGRYSYRELDLESNRLARHLRRLGIGADDRVALCMDRVARMLVGLLGILKAGGAYVPVDPSYPAERVAHMLDDSGARAVLTQRSRLAQLPPSAARTLCLDEPSGAWLDEDAQPLAAVSQPRHLAYVIYTSGSTGKPKGVQIEHGAVVNFVQAMAARPGMAAGDALLAVTTVSFDIHVLELFVPLAVGGCVVVAGRDTAADPQRLMAALQQPSIRLMQATPSTWRMLVDAGWPGSTELTLLCGGEALAPDLAQALLARCGALWNMYGPTEATVWATVDRVSAGSAITIGRPFDNMRAYVLDRLLQPQPVGVPGELCLGGQGVARGYLNRPQLTAERFIDSPFVTGERLYRTGDLARWRTDGRLEVLGRLDDQIKLRGHRVELGEIESVLATHPAIAHAVVWLREDRPGDQRLVAYALAGPAARPDLAELRRFAGQRLPDYMLPSALVWLERFPLTPNGKVDRRALPAPAPLTRDGRQEVAALQPAEAFFAGLFAEVLGTGGVGRYDNFFDLGGHSLLVMKVVDRVEQRTGIRMHPGELFQQTVGQLAALYGPRLPLPAPAADVATPGAAAPIEALLFAGSAGRLYGCHHRPTGLATGPAVLLCAPIAHEYARCHRALRQLAALLARHGCHVLRFDYFGLGDAEGEAEDLRLAQCEHDIASAIGELRQRSGASAVTVVGLRLGATAALRATRGRTDVGGLVLWHPVVDGQALLREWQDDQREFLQALGYRADALAGEVLGSPLPAELAHEIAAVTPAALATPQVRTLVLDGADRRQRGGPWPAPMALADAPIWRQQPLDALVSSQAMQAIVHWLECGA